LASIKKELQQAKKDNVTLARYINARRKNEEGGGPKEGEGGGSEEGNSGGTDVR
jgi:hypothetical protein